MSQRDLIVAGATALEHDDGEVVLREGRSVVVRGGEIVAVVDDTDLPAARDRAGLDPDVEVIDARGQVAMPGFVNCHTHSPMVMFRGAAEDIPAERWFNEYIWPMEVNLTDEDVALATRLAAAEMIQAGVTTFADHYFSMATIAGVVEEVGLRGVLGETYFSTDGAAGLERSLDFATGWRGKAEGRITTALAPHATYTVEHGDLVACASAAEEHDLLVHIHASESRGQVRTTRERHGITPIEQLRRAGLLEVPLLIAHGIGIAPEDLPSLAPVAGHVGVASAPRGYLKQGPHTTPVRALTAIGVAVGLATDGAASNNTLDVWEAMTFTALVQKAVEDDPTWMTARQCLRLATLDSARAVGLAGQVGSLAPGHRADIVLVDLSEARTQPVLDLANTLVHSARSSDVTTTIVDGRVLMRHRELTTIDLPAVTAELAPRLARLTDRSHGRSIQEYDT